ncbi:MAG: 4-hydroxy-4-methyl-2-oxoglutarate aldolase [Pirellulaceae bacterium]|jgi:4-hydroxy-4-methyl-2-oxoglutarate aldolase
MNITLEMMRESLYSAVVCDALDACGFNNQSPRLPFQPYTIQRTLVGRCKTTLWTDYYNELENPYELELRAVDECQVDDVMIAAVGGSLRSAVWGELLSTAARNQGCVGAIVDGAIRDIEKTCEVDFPVYALGTSPYDSQFRQRVIDIDVPVEMGGVRFCPGDLVIADRDGVCVVPAAAEEEVIQHAWDKVHTENHIREAIRNGMKAIEAYEKFGVL